MQVNELKLVALRQLGELVSRHRLELRAVDRHEAAEQKPLAGAQLDLRLHRLEQVQFLNFFAKALGKTELGLVFLQELQDLFDVGTRLAIIAEEPLAAPFPVEPGELFINAEHESLLLGTGREHEWVAAHKGGNVFGFPGRVLGKVEILVAPQPENDHRHDVPLRSAKHDGVVGGGLRELDCHERH